MNETKLSREALELLLLLFGPTSGMMISVASAPYTVEILEWTKVELDRIYNEEK